MSDVLPQEQISRMLSGYWISQALYVAAKLNIADLLGVGPMSADELASATHSHPKSLYRLLRGLASIGVFSEDNAGQFSLTPLAECLRTDVLGSKRSLAIMMGEEHYQAYGQLLYSVQTGKIAFDKLFGMPVFDFLQKHPEQAKVFDGAMVGVHGRETAAMLDAYDFSGISLLADIGGGNGSVLTAVLRKYTTMRGLLFDLPAVAERAKANVEATGLANRCQVIGGSFFESVAQGANAYMLRHIIHDWEDEKAITILRNVHRAMSSDGKLLVVESVIPPGNEPSFGKLLDLTMMAIPGGKERTEEEYRRLFTSAGFSLITIVPTKAEVSVIEGKKA
jgi:O-methyltransferase domain/Dimerisation domain